ncbi:hypothetical protein [Rathayibacter sp. AY1A7]|uniref:hypothetical protein n=1 Tax=Rathayibacter sp. AY1A7 TaxID=2080524 RepID=UPI000CE7D6C3|nr:hypothetical protein [Rathayibacter sp. AY1A7]PPF21022.1 hypothetical protein C5B95_06320 [Rathayibacter sp. AY1A7]
MNLAECNAAAERIRAAVPIEAGSATNDEVVRRLVLVAAELAELGVEPEPKMLWRETKHADGRTHGQWAHSLEAAALGCAMWWGVPVLDVRTLEPVAPPVVREVALW